MCLAVYGGASAQLNAPEPPSAEGSMPWLQMLRGREGARRTQSARLNICSASSCSFVERKVLIWCYLPSCYTTNLRSGRLRVQHAKWLRPTFNPALTVRQQRVSMFTSAGEAASAAGLDGAQQAWASQMAEEADKDTDARPAWSPQLEVPLVRSPSVRCAPLRRGG